MCRFAFYLGPPVTISSLVTEPANSIIHQSFSSRSHDERLNGDGFGLAWYVPHRPRPALFKDVMPAWSNLNLLNLAEVTQTGCLLAHVRAASPGSAVQQLNCHPFCWDSLSLMHNGSVGGFSTLRRAMVAEMSDEAFGSVRGSTDSEHLFGLAIDAYRGTCEQGSLPPLRALAATVRDVIARVEALRKAAGVEQPSLLNLVLADGKRAVASRFVSPGGPAAKTLHVCSGARYSCHDGVCHMLPEEGAGRAVIVASEPLSTDGTWAPVPENHLVLVDEDRSVSVVPI